MSFIIVSAALVFCMDLQLIPTVVMEHMDMDLKKYLDKRREPLKANQIKHIMKRILEGLRFLHQQAGVMHRDIKPGNILIKGDTDELKICDFGVSALSAALEAGRVGTPPYMAPEVVLGRYRHTCAVDMWSVGCIMAELVLPQRLFRGRHAGAAEHLRDIIYNLDLLPHKLKITTAAATLTPSGVDLLKRLLAYNPRHRITAQHALNHPWFSQL